MAHRLCARRFGRWSMHRGDRITSTLLPSFLQNSSPFNIHLRTRSSSQPSSPTPPSLPPPNSTRVTRSRSRTRTPSRTPTGRRRSPSLYRPTATSAVRARRASSARVRRRGCCTSTSCRGVWATWRRCESCYIFSLFGPFSLSSLTYSCLTLTSLSSFSLLTLPFFSLSESGGLKLTIGYPLDQEELEWADGVDLGLGRGGRT